ncbi:MAG TPA: hypothetical protein VFJ71_01760 [Candidatus Limnocylindrales bacterium]|nr:hypothetical protein [Candidatus Limnocylindrales bacterium]
MRAVVVFESIWGNTAAIAEAIAEGLGGDARALPTDEATREVVGAADLVVAGAPVMAFRLPTDGMRSRLLAGHDDAPRPADTSHPSMRSWLENVPVSQAWMAAFETRLHWSPGGSTGTIERILGRAGFRRVGRAAKFFVTGTYGPLKDGELERARAWGRELAAAAGVGARGREVAAAR